MEIHKTSHGEKCESSNPKPTPEEEEDAAEEEDEALSLCDLPVNLMREDNETSHRDDQSLLCSRTEEDFDFGSWNLSVPREPEMCAAEDVFFKGQILPLRLSVSSDGGWPGFRPESRCVSLSESMDHGSISRLTSVHSSRSNSTRSYYSSTSSSSVTSRSNSNPPRIRNNFHTHPSPKPQIRSSKTWAGIPNPRTTQKSTLWDFIKLGLIRAPEIELQDLKARNSLSSNSNRISVSRNSSCSSSNSNSSGSIKNHQETKRGFVEVKRSMGLFGGCKCSADAIQTMVLNDAVLVRSCKRNEDADGVEEKMMMIKKEEKEKMKRRGKQALSRRRTSEWLKELPHVRYGDD